MSKVYRMMTVDFGNDGYAKEKPSLWLIIKTIYLLRNSAVNIQITNNQVTSYKENV